MPAMTRVLHLYDQRTPPAAVEVLATLRGRQTDSLLARIGGPTRPHLPLADQVLRRLWGWSLTAAPEIRRFAEIRRVDAIHCWSPTVAEAAAATGLPTVLTLCRRPTRREAKAIRCAAGEGAFVVAGSAALAKAVTPERVATHRLGVIEPAAERPAPRYQVRERLGLVGVIEPAAERPAPRDQVRERLGLAPDAFVAIAPPQQTRDRGPMWAVWALGILHYAGIRTRLILPGPSSLARSARDLATGARLSSMVWSPGVLDADTAGDLYAAADLTVLYDDTGFGAAAAAMAVAAGSAIVAADAGELACILRDGETAVLVAPRTPRLLARAIWRLYEDRPTIAHLARQAAAELTALTDVEGMVRRYDALYAVRTPTPT